MTRNTAASDAFSQGALLGLIQPHSASTAPTEKLPH